MKERINWIDWVKAWCMTVVVFDHTPHDASPFLLQFLAGTNLASFFFISGYLKKPIKSQKEALKKYAYCLLIPYFIYNAIYYPYWVVKTYIEQGGALSYSDCVKPIIGTLLGQLNSIFSCELNGVTWFLITLFAMHWLADFCNRQRHCKLWMICISITAMILYGANKYYHFTPYLTFHALVRCIPFFFMGNMLRNANYLKKSYFKTDFFIGASALGISFLLFYWHIREQNHIIHILLYFILNLTSIFAVIHLWRCADSIRLKPVLYISIGTMVIFGLHRILIGMVDFTMEKSLHLIDISYSWYDSVILALTIEILLLPVIYLANKYFPILLGKKNATKFG
jgi:fucose 4-O-acetylase-like acetyltransferase